MASLYFALIFEDIWRYVEIVLWDAIVTSRSLQLRFWRIRRNNRRWKHPSSLEVGAFARWGSQKDCCRKAALDAQQDKKLEEK